jgi:hypothetical protein
MLMMNKHNTLWSLFLMALFTVSLPQSTFGQSWIWATQIYGPDKDEIMGVATNHQGDLFVCGRYQDTIKFSPTVFFTGNPTYYNGFIAKYDSSGAFLWARNFGGNHNDYASAIVTDDSGYVYVACYGRSSTPITFDSFSYTGTGNDKTFLLKLDPSSGNLVWGKLLTAGTSNAYPRSIDVRNGIVAISGNYAFLNLIIENDTLFHWGSDDIFLATYSAASGNLLWTKALRSQFQDYANDVVVDDSGNVYLSGIFNSTLSIGDVDTLFTPWGNEIFLCKHDQYGQYQWVIRYNGAYDHQVDALKVNSAGDLYIAGWHSSGTHVLNDTTFSMLHANNFFLQKVSPSGSSYWTRHYQGGNLGRIIGMAIDPSDNVVLSGYLGSQFLFDTIPVVGYSSNYRMFLAKIDGNGNVMGAIDGGNRVNNFGLNNVAADPFGNIYTVGWFGTATGQFCVFGNDTLVSTGESDGYIVKYGIPGGTPCVVQAGFVYPGQPYCEGDSLPLANTSQNATAYQWLLNGTAFSQIEHPVIQLPAPGHSTITLIASAAGCYDTIEHVLYVSQKWHQDVYDSICLGEQYLFDGLVLTSPGTYTSHHTAISGCDSVTKLHLHVDTFFVSFAVFGDSAVASTGAVTWQWLNCDQNMSPVPGATNHYYLPDQSGNYTVIASNSMCTDTAACQYILVVSVEHLQPGNAPVSIHPVPAHNYIVISGLPEIGSFHAEVYDISGRLLIKASVSATDPVLQISALPAGNYILRLSLDGALPKRFVFARE